jgi:nickel/cobalt transporter (NicO) family protein
MRRFLTTLFLVALVASDGHAHDIPNARVDRSIQATLRPGRLEIDYEVSLAELTLIQDLRALIGTLPDGDRQVLFQRYGQETGPLNARGFLVSVDGQPIDLVLRGFQLAVEEHPRYTFHFEAPMPEHGRLVIRDTNYVASEGTSRLGLRRLGGIVATGDDLPEDAERIPIRPVWQLTDAEEKRTRRIDVRFSPAADLGASAGRSPAAAPSTSAGGSVLRGPGPASGWRAPDRLARLLDSQAGLPLGVLWLLALMLGAAHAIQPGHGKALVAAATIAEGGGWRRGVALALLLTFAHTAGVVAIALAFWATRSTRYADINTALTRVAGFMIAAVGFWRLGRHLGNQDETADEPGTVVLGTRGLIGLGLAGGLVPCWDAVVLVILAEALGRLGLGLFLLLGFSLGLAGVLVLVGLAAARLRGLAERYDHEGLWERRLGIASALALAGIGLYLLW